MELWATCGIVTEATTQDTTYRTDKGIRVRDSVDKAISAYGGKYTMGNIEEVEHGDVQVYRAFA